MKRRPRGTVQGAKLPRAKRSSSLKVRIPPRFSEMQPVAPPHQLLQETWSFPRSSLSSPDSLLLYDSSESSLTNSAYLSEYTDSAPPSAYDALDFEWSLGMSTEYVPEDTEPRSVAYKDLTMHELDYHATWVPL